MFTAGDQAVTPNRQLQNSRWKYKSPNSSIPGICSQLNKSGVTEQYMDFAPLKIWIQAHNEPKTCALKNGQGVITNLRNMMKRTAIHK